MWVKFVRFLITAALDDRREDEEEAGFGDVGRDALDGSGKATAVAWLRKELQSSQYIVCMYMYTVSSVCIYMHVCIHTCMCNKILLRPYVYLYYMYI